MSQQRIAVVDDDEIFQVIAKKMMSICAPEWNVIAFVNGSQILQYLKEHAHDPEQIPDVMLLDINMPQIDGWMFLQEFKNLKHALKKPIRIYLTSSSIDPKDISRAKLETDLVDYIIKPLTVDLTTRIIKG